MALVAVLVVVSAALAAAFPVVGTATFSIIPSVTESPIIGAVPVAVLLAMATQVALVARVVTVGTMALVAMVAMVALMALLGLRRAAVLILSMIPGGLLCGMIPVGRPLSVPDVPVAVVGLP